MGEGSPEQGSVNPPVSMSGTASSHPYREMWGQTLHVLSNSEADSVGWLPTGCPPSSTSVFLWFLTKTLLYPPFSLESWFQPSFTWSSAPSLSWISWQLLLVVKKEVTLQHLSVAQTHLMHGYICQLASRARMASKKLPACYLTSGCCLWAISLLGQVLPRDTNGQLPFAIPSPTWQSWDHPTHHTLGAS